MATTDGPRHATGEPADLGPGTLVDLFLGGVEAHRSSEARRVRRRDGTWTSRSYGEVAAAVRDVAQGLLAARGVSAASSARPGRR